MRTSFRSTREAPGEGDVVPGCAAELLGADGKRTYVVLIQQNATERGTGGGVDSYAIVNADSGTRFPREGPGRKDMVPYSVRARRAGRTGQPGPAVDRGGLPRHRHRGLLDADRVGRGDRLLDRAADALQSIGPPEVVAGDKLVAAG